MLFDEEFSSNQVFKLRKEGKIDEAYALAIKLYELNGSDVWVKKAYAWVLIDIIKRALDNNQNNNAVTLFQQLKSIDFDSFGLFPGKKQEKDEIIESQINLLEIKLIPEIRQAIQLSKQNQHQQAVELYRTFLKKHPNFTHLHESFGWELYRVGKDIFGTEKIDVYKAKQLLNEYIKLKNERPSRLHSLFLRYADKLIGSEGFNLVAFLRFWDLNNLTHEDYEPYQADNGKSYPSVAEKVIQHAAKDALSRHIEDDMKYIIPYVDNAIGTFPENFWLTYYKAKLLLGVGENREAYEFSLSVAKAKLNEYWAWDLLAETLIGTDTEKVFGCYSKALTCRSDEKFLANVRMKFADLLIQKSLYREAKYEIDQAIKGREQEGWKLTETQLQYKSSEWYKNTTATKDNRDFYKQYSYIAEALLFDSLPWLNASLGNTFTTTKNPDKPKRKIFLSMANQSTPIEISVSEKRYPFKSMKLGSGLKVKGEYDVERRFQIYLIEPRSEAQQWDVFSEYIGIIDHVNHDKKLAHFIVDRKIDGVIHFEDFATKFNVADIVEIKLALHTNDRRIQYSVLSCLPTDKEISSSTAKKFQSTVRISNGLGFTANDIFIDRPFVDHYSMQDGDKVEGLSVLNYNKKKSTWGWKALNIEKHEKSIQEENDDYDIV